MRLNVHRFAVWIVRLDPTLGREMKKTRPCVVISPDEMNRVMGTVIVAPMTSKETGFPMRVTCRVEGRLCQIALDQMRAVDKTRLVRKIDDVRGSSRCNLLAVLQEMFAS